MGRTLGRHIRVVVPAQDVGSPFQRVMTNSPTPLGVAIDLPGGRVHPDADGAYERRLAKIRAESGPEVVIQVRAAVDRAGMERKPMPYRIEEGNEESDSRHHQDKDDSEYEPSDSGPFPGVGLGPRPVAAAGYERGSRQCGRSGYYGGIRHRQPSLGEP